MGSLSLGWWVPEGGQRGPVEPGEGGLRLGSSLWPRTSPCLMKRTADPSWVKWHLCFEVYVFVPMCLYVCEREKERGFEKLETLFKSVFFFFFSSLLWWFFPPFMMSLSLTFEMGFSLFSGELSIHVTYKLFCEQLSFLLGIFTSHRWNANCVETQIWEM